MGRRKWVRLTIVSLLALLFAIGYTNEKALLTGEREWAVNAAEAPIESAVTAPPASAAPAASVEAADVPAAVEQTDASADNSAEAGADPGSAVPGEVPVGHASGEKPAEAAHARPGTKKIALTFDDGPDKTYTPQILDILKQRNVKATFFVVGIQIKKYEDVLKRIAEEGHAVGNHSWDHAKLTERTPGQIADEISRTEDAIEAALGERSGLFRPPYGATDDKVKRAAADSGRPLILWSVDTRDWAGTPPKDIVSNVEEHSRPGGIILMHSFGGKDGKLDNTVEALPQVIDLLHKQGYTLVTVPELLADLAG